MGTYYDGHYKESSLTLEEIEKKVRSENLSECPKDTE